MAATSSRSTKMRPLAGDGFSSPPSRSSRAGRFAGSKRAIIGAATSIHQATMRAEPMANGRKQAIKQRSRTRRPRPRGLDRRGKQIAANQSQTHGETAVRIDPECQNKRRNEQQPPSSLGHLQHTEKRYEKQERKCLRPDQEKLPQTEKREGAD